MELKKIIQDKQLLQLSKNIKPIVNCEIDNKKIDSLIEEFSDLTRFGSNNDKHSDPWFAAKIRELGIDRWMRFAKTARQEGNNPPRYFSWLLTNQGDI